MIQTQLKKKFKFSEHSMGENISTPYLVTISFKMALSTTILILIPLSKIELQKGKTVIFQKLPDLLCFPQTYLNTFGVKPFLLLPTLSIECPLESITTKLLQKYSQASFLKIEPYHHYLLRYLDVMSLSMFTNNFGVSQILKPLSVFSCIQAHKKGTSVILQKLGNSILQWMSLFFQHQSFYPTKTHLQGENSNIESKSEDSFWSFILPEESLSPPSQNAQINTQVPTNPDSLEPTLQDHSKSLVTSSPIRVQLESTPELCVYSRRKQPPAEEYHTFPEQGRESNNTLSCYMSHERTSYCSKEGSSIVHYASDLILCELCEALSQLSHLCYYPPWSSDKHLKVYV